MKQVKKVALWLWAIVAFVIRVIQAIITVGGSEKTLKALELYRLAFMQTRQGIKEFRNVLGENGNAPTWEVLGDILDRVQDGDVKKLVDAAEGVKVWRDLFLDLLPRDKLD